jgi:hypothetical protein
MSMSYEKVSKRVCAEIVVVPVRSCNQHRGLIYEALDSIRHGYYNIVCRRLRSSSETGI